MPIPPEPTIAPGTPECPTATATTNTSSLMARALAAADRADTPPSGTTSSRATRRHRFARTLARVLGTTTDRVAVSDDPDRTRGGWPAPLATVTDTSGTWRFTPGPHGEPLLLDACPACGGQVTVATITDLVDLGRHLRTWPDHGHNAVPDGYDTDPGHTPDCSEHAPTRP